VSEEQFGPISDLGKRYLAGSLRQQHLEGDFSPSVRDDVVHCEDLNTAHEALEKAALEQLRQGRVAFGVLAAGASSRMHLRDIPADVFAAGNPCRVIREIAD
jgi:CTP:molybdopterin cytidylyltransferase MocA